MQTKIFTKIKKYNFCFVETKTDIVNIYKIHLLNNT